ncbi:hypothetical protein F5Y04DRAFT_278765 [Hypomontagnella monticulosa]|nr:hypothetical protein F5Y04DRAFT_278765 [Hypomontagnella monticulosa]
MKPSDRKKSSRKGCGCGCGCGWILLLLYVLLFLSTTIIGVLMLVGSISTNSSIENIYLAQLRMNTTADVQLRVGYFGGCVSIPSSPSSSPYCITSMRDMSPEDLSEEFEEKTGASGEALGKIIPIAKHLQDDVFYWEAPVLSTVFFSISGIMLFVTLTASSNKLSYKFVVLLALVFSTISIALAFVASIGSQQALNALLKGTTHAKSAALSDGISIDRGRTQQILSDVFVASVTIYYAVTGVLFVRAGSGGKKGAGKDADNGGFGGDYIVNFW